MKIRRRASIDHPPRGPDDPSKEELIAQLRSNLEGSCWWCGGEDVSQEHKHKKTLLKRRLAESELDLVTPNARPHRIQGPNSRAVKFSRIFCRHCNNARSQPFDRAYDKFVDHLDANRVSVSRKGLIDWRDVYGDDWSEGAQALGRYFVKNFGCWMAHGGFEPPQAFRTFLDGGNLVDTRIMIVRRKRDSIINAAFRHAGRPDIDNGFGSEPESGCPDIDRTRLIAYESGSYIRDVVTQFNWADQTGPGELFWSRRTIKLAILPLTRQDRQQVRMAKSGIKREFSNQSSVGE